MDRWQPALDTLALLRRPPLQTPTTIISNSTARPVTPSGEATLREAPENCVAITRAE